MFYSYFLSPVLLLNAMNPRFGAGKTSHNFFYHLCLVVSILLVKGGLLYVVKLFLSEPEPALWFLLAKPFYEYFCNLFSVFSPGWT